ncbi:MAG: Pyridinium-3,5-biscarboxylic acid mononucleotide sulfurtransferase [Phycisphaerae bacterium]|nr:Pyridinium-3,5-biscarboxylic acid mononucleotide sulfurtransferase [Phycisphaerae bacterium]
MSKNAAATVDATQAEARYAQLADLLRGMGEVCVAFSGGVDSAFVLAAAVAALGPARVTAVTGLSGALPVRERNEARQFARDLGCRHVEIRTFEIDDENYASNPADRCYFCKSELYTHLKRYAAEHGIAFMLNGANADDRGDWRPGMAAADEFHIRSPLLECELTKAEVRHLSRKLGLPTADKPAMACLASRFPYGTRVTPEALARVEAAEDYLWGLGLRDFRVRHHDTLARIELPADRIAEFAAPDRRRELVTRFREIGYTYATLDLQGFRSGSGNEVLAQLKAPAADQA